MATPHGERRNRANLRSYPPNTTECMDGFGRLFAFAGVAGNQTLDERFTLTSLGGLAITRVSWIERLASREE